MKIGVEKLKKAMPLVKEYVSTRGTHDDQPFTSRSVPYYNNAVSAFISRGVLTRENRNSSYCYASLFSSVKKGDIILLQVQPCWDDADQEAYRHYIEWVVNYSPWRHAFISKNINRILRDGVAVLEWTEHTKSYVKAAAIALRMAWENYGGTHKYQEVGLWWEISQKVDPKIAFVAGKTLFAPEKATSGFIIPKAYDDGHTPLNYNRGHSNRHIVGFVREDWASRNWKALEGTLVFDIIAVADSIAGDKKALNPFNAESQSKKFRREAFVEAMHSELPKIAEKVYA